MYFRCELTITPGILGKSYDDFSFYPDVGRRMEADWPKGSWWLLMVDQQFWRFPKFPNDWNLPSGNLLQFAIENGPVKIVDLPINIVIFHRFLYVYQRVYV